jgi:iron complex outermembrane receptor protein
LYSGALNRFEPNPELRPETLLGLEGGVTMDRAIGPLPDVTVQGVVFHHNLDDAVVRITQPDLRFKRVNRDRIRSTGLELLAGMAFGPHKDRAVSITSDALLQRVRVFDRTSATSAERHAEHQPQARGMVELGLPLPAALRATANARFTGSQYCVHPDLGEQRLGPQREMDLAIQRDVRVARSIFESLRAIVAVDNVANAAVYDQCGLPQSGRTFRLGLQIR